MLRARHFSALVLTAVLCVPPVGAAIPPHLEMYPSPCIPEGGNEAFYATGPEALPEGAELRLYFRREGHGDFYYVFMEPAEGQSGLYWGVPPKPDPMNHGVELYAALMSQDGVLLSQSSHYIAPVSTDCPVELSQDQRDRSVSLDVGETAIGQKHEWIAWFLCDGISSRIDVHGEVREAPACVPVIVLLPPTHVAPLVAAGLTSGLIIGGSDDEPASPSRP
jgi:hypothetical protein